METGTPNEAFIAKDGLDSALEKVRKPIVDLEDEAIKPETRQKLQTIVTASFLAGIIQKKRAEVQNPSAAIVDNAVKTGRITEEQGNWVRSFASEGEPSS